MLIGSRVRVTIILSPASVCQQGCTLPATACSSPKRQKKKRHQDIPGGHQNAWMRPSISEF